ncbi:thioredoxin domain-containing protein [Sarocladium implicatum]|nr:thioredoxin domain-containing protein [Sarocladium implicatum]
MSAARAFRPASALRSRLPVTLGAPRRFHASSYNYAVHDVKSKEEFAEALKKPVVVLDCFAEWCGPCKAISPILQKLSDDPANQDIHFVKIDVDELPQLSAELGIRAMPTFIFFKDGEKSKELVGANPPALQKLVEAHRPSA